MILSDCPPLQVGTLSLPLHGLLRQGQPSTELLLRVPVTDPNRAISRLDPGGSTVQLCCSPLHGSLIVRLACAGSQLDLQAACAKAVQPGSRSWPASPLRQQQGQSDGTVVVRAKPALEEGGQLALELARQEGVSRVRSGTQTASGRLPMHSCFPMRAQLCVAQRTKHIPTQQPTHDLPTCLNALLPCRCRRARLPIAWPKRWWGGRPPRCSACCTTARCLAQPGGTSPAAAQVWLRQAALTAPWAAGGMHRPQLEIASQAAVQDAAPARRACCWRSAC